MYNGEQNLMLADSKYRSYATSMEKALKGFESTHEWADLISALSKINKVIIANKSYNVLPKKVTVGKRLAQCLHPALPAGVHIKALELYETIFKTVGPAHIAKDFPIYSAGLLPLHSHAAMTVKPVLLRLYENFVLPICSSIKPAAAGIILGILPGLEEGSEFYDWTNSLLDSFSISFGVEHFYSNLWSCLHSNSSVRLAGTCYFLSHFDKSRSMEDQLYLLGSDLGLLVSALKACLEDSAVLVQRNTLDILSVAFPFHDTQLIKSDQSEVIGSAILVLLRRDMSLNRRLYAWLLGVSSAGGSVVKRVKSDPETSRQRLDSGSSSASEPELEYFHTHSRRLLVQSLRSHMDQITDAVADDIIRPLRVIISLLDRAEIGSVVLEDIFISLFRLLRRFHSTHAEKPLASSTQMCTYRLAHSLNIDLHATSTHHKSSCNITEQLRSELLKTCNLLFSTLEPHFIWEFLADTYEKVLWPSEVRPSTDLCMSEFCDMVDMLLSIMALEIYVETQSVHLPRLLYNLLNMLRQNLAATSLSDITQVLLLCRRLVSVILPADVVGATTDDSVTDAVSVDDCVPFVQDILHLRILSSDKSGQEVDEESRRHSLLSCSFLLIEMSSSPIYVPQTLSSSAGATQTNGHSQNIPKWIQSVIAVSTGAISHDIQCQFISAALLLDLISLSDLSLETNSKSRPLYRARSVDSSEASGNSVTVNIRPLIAAELMESIRSELEGVFSYIWSNMDAESLEYSRECCYLLSSLLAVAAGNGQGETRGFSDAMQTVVIKDLTHKDNDRRLEAYKKFSLFWHQTRDLQASSSHSHHILMVMLSSLMFETELVQEVIRNWVIHSIQCEDINRILEPFLIILLESDTSRSSVQQKHKPKTAADSKEDAFSKSLEKAEAQIRAIGSDGRVLVREQSTTSERDGRSQVKAVTQTLVTKEGTVAASQMVNEPLDCDNVRRYSSAGLALNPFGSASDLDHLIFDGFTPHELLKNRWSAVSNGGKVDYRSIISRARRLDRETCEREGIVFDEKASQKPTNTEERSPQGSTETDSGHPAASAASAANSTPTVNGVIALPDKHLPHRAMEEPPPLDDSDVLEVAETLVNDIITGAMSKFDTDNAAGDGEITHVDDASTSGSSKLSVSDTAPQVVDTGRRTSLTSSITSTGSVSSTDSILNPAQGESQAEAGPSTASPGSHGFVLIYDQCYDTDRVLFALSVIQSVIEINPSLVLSSLTTSACSDVQLIALLARHNKALGGENYYTPVSQEEIIALRNTRLLEILVTVCLYLWRSYHPSNHKKDSCVSQNSQVQLKAINTLLILTTDLSFILADSPKGFPEYMVDVLTRCKVVKTCIFHLQCLLDERQSKLSAIGASHDKAVDELMFSKCLQLTEALIIFESKLQLIHDTQSLTAKGGTPALFKRMMFSHPLLHASLSSQLSEAKYAGVHHQWLAMLTNSLPHVLTQSNTADVVQNVIVKVCDIFDRISAEQCDSNCSEDYPPDYIQQLLEDFTVICHFCFMEVSGGIVGHSGSDDSKPSGISTGQILSNLVSVFNPLGSKRGLRSSSEQRHAGGASGDPRIKCRDRLLSMLPKILASVSNLWRVYQLADNQKVVQLVIEFFSPILHNYTEQLLGSVAVVWSDSQEAVCSTAHSTQSTLVDLLISIKALPMDTIVDKLGLVMKKPPNTDHQTNARVILQLSCLKFLRGYIIKTPTILKSSLSSVCSLLKHCLQLGLPAPGTLLLLETVTEFVHKLGIIEERKVVKDIQDIVGKVLEACCEIISSQLEASSWTIRKNYTVKVKAPSLEPSDLYNMPGDSLSSAAPGISVDDAVSTEEHESEYTSHALSLLAEVTAGLLDVIYPSEDKDKVASLLTNILSRVFPYLRNHSLLNMSCFQAGSKLLASISSYQYTRRTWKRDVYDILLSPDFFKMDVQSLQFWKILVDNLVTHEKAMFKDLLARFTITPSTIQLFSSRETELSTRVHNLKKLTLIIYCGDIDHYRHYMPDIQERLAENLRLTQAPAVLSQAFLCFRVLLLRMSSDALTSLWPTILTELVYVMTQIEQDLSLTEEEEHQMSRVSEIDSFSSLNELNMHHSPSWLQLYLSACKLLDLLMYLPPGVIPDFQHYIWMFTGVDDSVMTDSEPATVANQSVYSSTAYNRSSHRTSSANQKANGAGSANQTEAAERTLVGFSAHIPKIAHMMLWKFGEYRSPSNQSKSLLLQQQTISTLTDLQPFFARLLTSFAPSVSCDNGRILKEAEYVLDNDLIEPVS